MSGEGETYDKEKAGGTLLPLSKIKLNPDQPRRVFSKENMANLIQSIKVDGIIQPVIVSECGGGEFILVAGERRLRAAKALGQHLIPAVVRSTSPSELLRVALVENIQRKDLNCIEEAEAYEALITEQRLTQEQCALMVGKDRSTVANHLRILRLPKDIKDDLVKEKYSLGHAKILSSIEDSAKLYKLREQILTHNLSVKETSRLLKKESRTGERRDQVGFDASIEYLANRLRAQLKTKVKLRGNREKGRIELSYFSSAELNRIVALFTKSH